MGRKTKHIPPLDATFNQAVRAVAKFKYTPQKQAKKRNK